MYEPICVASPEIIGLKVWSRQNDRQTDRRIIWHHKRGYADFSFQLKLLLPYLLCFQGDKTESLFVLILTPNFACRKVSPFFICVRLSVKKVSALSSFINLILFSLLFVYYFFQSQLPLFFPIFFGWKHFFKQFYNILEILLLRIGV